MRNSKPGLRVFGLAILGALSLTAFFAAGASATSLPSLSTLGQFQINLVPVALLAKISGAQEGAGKLLVPGRNLTIECASGKVTGAEIHSSTDAEGTALFSKCVAWNLAQTQVLPCLVLSPGEETEDSVAASALVEPILHGGKNFALFKAIGLNFAEVELHGATCPLPLVNPTKGSVAAEVIVNHAEKPLIKFSQAIQELTGDKLLFGGFPAFIDADATVELIDEHEKKELGIL